MKSGQKSIIFIILSLFILSFSFPAKTIKLLLNVEDNVTLGISIEESEDSKKINEDKDIYDDILFHYPQKQVLNYRNVYDFINLYKSYIKIISPPPESKID